MKDKKYVSRTGKLIFGLFLFAVGSYLSIKANIGLAPWDAFNIGVSGLTGLSYGDISMYTGFVIIGVDFLLKEKIGFGTILNTILIGKFVDFLQSLHLMETLDHFWLGVALLFVGQIITCLGCYFYIGAALGCGPRDALMVALGKRLPKLPIGVIKGAIEATVLVIGWLLGAKVGLGTVISVFGISFIMQFTFKLLHFDVKEVAHESMVDTVKVFLKKEEKPQEQEDLTVS